MIMLKQTKYQPCDAASGPLGPIETLGLAILQGTCDIFKDPLKKQKVDLFIAKVCLFNYAYKTLLILTIEPRVAPRPPLHIWNTIKPN